jgi:hypothetical protein
MGDGCGDSDGELENIDEERPSELWDTIEIYEKLLDTPRTPDTGPVITLDEYELSDEEEEAHEDSDVDKVDDSGEAWKAGVPDAVWASESEERHVVVLDNDIPEVSSQVDHGSDIDSDFDSDGR